MAEQNEAYDLVIVGAGMVGLSLACALAPSDLRIAIVDRNPIADKDTWQGIDPRVSAIVKSSEYFLRNVGAWEYIEKDPYSSFVGMEVWEKDGTSRIHFDSAELGHGELGLIVENRILQRGMYDSLADKKNVDWFFSDDIQSINEQSNDVKKYWKLQFESGQNLFSELLVGADGALSFVRETLAIPLKTKDLGHKAMVCNVECELPHNKIARQIFLPSGPLAFLPLGSGSKTCSIVWSSEPEVTDDLMAFDEAAFNKKLSIVFERELGEVLSSDRRFSFPLFQRHAKSYIAKQAALIGDAAHTIHPLAGQGVNLGFMDAAVLAEEIIRAHDRGVALSSQEVLRRYERRRRGQVSLMMESMRGFQQVYAAKNADFIALRNLGVKLTNAFAPLKNHVLSRAMGLQGDLPKLAQRC